MIWQRDETDLLLAVAAADAAAATAAWRRWQAAADLDTLPAAQFPLLPRLHAVLTRLGLADEADPRLKGIYRRAWYRNQRTLASLDALLADFAAAGIPLCVIGAAAVGLTCYPHLAERPLEPLEVLVPPALFDAALDRLLAAGWRSDRPAALIRSANYRRWQHRATLRRAGDPAPLGLCWRLLPEGPPVSEALRNQDFSRSVCQRQKPAEASSPDPQRTILCIETQLVLAGAAVGVAGPGRLAAAADLALILQGGRTIAWERVCAQARRLQSAQPLRTALSAVGELLALPIPADVLAQLEASGRAELAPAVPPTRRGIVGLPGRVRYHVQRWRRIARANGDRPTMAGLVCYLQTAAGAASRRELLRRLARALLRPRSAGARTGSGTGMG